MSNSQPGSRFRARVGDLASDGRAVVKHPDGRTCFVAGAWPGEVVEVEITEVRGRVGQARLLAIVEAHPQRRAAPCPHHGFSKADCGGCPWQFMDYSAQLAAKQQRVQHAFERLGAGAQVRPALAAPAELGYRMRAQFKTDGRQLGFVAASSQHLAPIEDCLVLSEANRAQLAELRAQLPNTAWQPAKRQTWTTLDIDETHAPSVNQRLPFQQANAAQNLAMQQWLRDKVQDLDPARKVLELFAGAGNFTQVLAERGFAKIWAAEIAGDAIQFLNDRQLANTEGLVKNLFTEKGMNETLFAAREADILVLDPPREGMKEFGKLLDKKSRFREVFYISCDLATLTRDVARFQESGFLIKEVQPVDQFPQTAHVELMVCLRRK